MASLTSMNGFNYPGPDIPMGYAIRQGKGTTGRFIVVNEFSLMGGPNSPPHTMDLELASAGASMHFPKLPVSAHFHKGDGSPTDSEALPGQRLYLVPGD